MANKILAIVLIATSLTIWAGESKAGSQYNADACELTIDVTYAGDWNDLHIRCKDGDKGSNFTTSTDGWRVDGVTTDAGNSYLDISRSAMTPQNQTVKVKHLDKGPRGGYGRIYITKDGKKLSQIPFGPSMLSADVRPATSLWGLIIMASVLLAAGAIVLVRRKRLTA